MKSVYIGEDAEDMDLEDDKESIESDSEDEGDLSTSTIAIGHLKWGGQDFIRTDLTFGAGERVKFTVVGDGEVHLAGKLVVDDVASALGVNGLNSDDEDDDDEYAVAEAGDLMMTGDDSDEESEEYVEVDSDDEEIYLHGESSDEDNSEIDSDEGETIYLSRNKPSRNGMDEDEVVIGQDDSSDDENVDGDFIVNPDDLSDSENDGIVLVQADSDSDDEDMMHADPLAYRRMLLGEDAGARPDSDDEDIDDEALYAAMAADDDSADGELADEADFITSGSKKNKKRARSSSVEPEFSSPGHKRSKHRENANGNQHHGFKKHGRNHKRR